MLTFQVDSQNTWNYSSIYCDQMDSTKTDATLQENVEKWYRDPSFNIYNYIYNNLERLVH